MAEKVEIEALINTAKTSNNMKELRKTIRELSGAAEAIGDRGSKEFRRIAAVIGDTQDKLEDLKEDLTAFKGSAVEKFNAGIQVLKERLANLDFKGVGDSLKTLGNVIKANPIGLLVTAIMFLINAFDDLKNAGGVVGKVFTAIGDIIKGIIQFYKDLGDAIGLTGFAAQEEAKKTEAANKKVQDSIINRYQTEIDYAAAAGKATEDAEIRKQRAILETNKKAIEKLVLQQKLNGELTEEEQKQLDELIKSTEDAYKTINIAQIKKNKDAEESAKKTAEEIAENERELQKRIKDLRDAAIKDDEMREMQQLITKVTRDKESIKQTKATQKTKNEAIKLIDEAFQKDLLEISKKYDQIRKEDYQNVLDARYNGEAAFKKKVAEEMEKANEEDEKNSKEQMKQMMERQEAESNAAKKAAKEKKDLNDGVRQSINATTKAAVEFSQVLQQQAIDEKNAKLKALNEFDAAEQQKNKDRLARREITEAQFAQIENTARIKSEQKKREIEKAAFEKFRRAKRAEIAINLATELSAIATSAAANPANAVTFGAAGAAQAAALTAAALIKAKSAYNNLDAQKPYRKGGILQGASHERGGIPTPYGELEGGEAVINTKSTSMFKPLLSAINEAGGGRRFAMGGVLSQQEQINQIQQAVTAVQTPVIKTYVLQSDVADANRQVERISRRNTI